ncbi:hypothetical protein COCVIDRAFT_11885 [Bipolaris victoriae FI3]|uniref:Uncharacterized protein n=2 Tax=Bipolaris TaxID=33194 RepID=W6YMG9_COCC2|nr:uncharacterized protein COCCADRAFT_22003 [Bipolaris zeicola 26-R-13]XP_014561431.1 hypothetical protein COCVIDRAFT_11885 [Bipolaris victoriae FI3]EUC38688.1 hypothetical protein COCCADRAFT_22003 [Bipolaris zeicola 26-R-13]
MAPKSLNNTYIFPPAPQRNKIIFAGVVMVLAALPTPSFLLPSSTVLPATVARYLRYTKNFVYYFLYIAHAAETAWFTTQLAKYGVSFGSSAWWKWMGTSFLGGIYCFDYFGKAVGEKII